MLTNQTFADSMPDSSSMAQGLPTNPILVDSFAVSTSDVVLAATLEGTPMWV